MQSARSKLEARKRERAWRTLQRMRKRSYKASSSSDSGSSLLAATRHTSGTGVRSLPLSKSRSLSSVSSVFKMALFALNTSSMNATSACARAPAMTHQHGDAVPRARLLLGLALEESDEMQGD